MSADPSGSNSTNTPLKPQSAHPSAHAANQRSRQPSIHPSIHASIHHPSTISYVIRSSTTPAAICHASLRASTHPSTQPIIHSSTHSGTDPSIHSSARPPTHPSTHADIDPPRHHAAICPAFCKPSLHAQSASAEHAKR